MAYDNLAYKYDYQESERKKKSNIKKVNNHKKTQISYPAKVAAVLVVCFSALFMIMQFIEVNKINSELRNLRSEYEFEAAMTSQIAFELEQSIDLSKIEQEATERLGMHRPERHQIVYIDVKQSDLTEKTAGEVEGFGNRFSEFVSNTVSNIVDFFSI